MVLISDILVCIPATRNIPFTVFLVGDDDKSDALPASKSHGPPWIVSLIRHEAFGNVRGAVPVHCALGVTPGLTTLIPPHGRRVRRLIEGQIYF